MRGMLKLLPLICCAVLSLVSMAHAGWTGPTEVVTATFGFADGQVGFRDLQYGGSFLRSFGISLSGKIAVADTVNGRLVMFGPNGQFIRSISSPVQVKGWPYEVVVGGECAVVSYVKFTHTFDMTTGALIGDPSNMGGGQVVSDDCSRIYVWTEVNGKDVWRTYTPTGTVLEEVETEPLELGRVDKIYLGNGQYEKTVTYPDKTWTFTSPSASIAFKRDIAGNLYSNESRRVDRRDDLGAVIASVSIPDNVKIVTPSDSPGAEDNYEYPEMYGDAYIAPNGDVYCWKKTPTTYSILKWAWQEAGN